MADHKSKKPHDEKSTEKKDDNMPSTRFEDDNLLGSALASDDAGLPSPDNMAELHDQIASLSKTLQEEQEKVAAYWDRLLRREAEFQNLQKRMQDEVEKTRKFAIDRFAMEMLDVLDSLEHGINFAQGDQASAQSLLEGMKMTQNIMLNALDKQGIQPIAQQQGEAFNPSFHEAISVQETNEMPSNQVVALAQKGYMLNNRLLRPARVVVSKQPA